MRQAAANNMFDSIDILVGSIGTSVLSEVDREEFRQWGDNAVIGGRILGSLTDPAQNTFRPNERIEQDIIEEFSEDRLPVTGFFSSAYAAVQWYATAAEQAVRTLGRYPETDELTEFMSNYGFWTHAGFHATDHRLQNGRQNYSNLYSGRPVYDEGKGRLTLTDINEYPAQYVTPPPDRDVIEWIESW